MNDILIGETTSFSLNGRYATDEFLFVSFRLAEVSEQNQVAVVAVELSAVNLCEFFEFWRIATNRRDDPHLSRKNEKL